MKHIAFLLALIFTTQAFAARTQYFDADSYNFGGTGAITKDELYRLLGLTSNAQTQLNAKAPLASPTFTGVPAAPTAAPGTNTTQLATTAFVTGALTNGVNGPGSSTANEVMSFSGTDGKTLQNTTARLTTAGALSGLTGLATSGIATLSGSLLLSGEATIATTGTAQELTVGNSFNYQLTADALVSVCGLTAPSNGRMYILTNTSNTAKTLLNESTSCATAANRISTGTGKNFTLAVGASTLIRYSNARDRWDLISGAGSGGGVSSTEIMFVQDFETASLSDFTQTGLSLDTAAPLHGDISGKITHATSVTTYSVKQTIAVNEKFRGKNITFRISGKSSASSGNVLLDMGCSTDTDLISGQTMAFSSSTGGSVLYAYADIPTSCTSLSYTIRALPETGPPVTYLDDIAAYITEYAVQTATVEYPDSYVEVNTANGFGSTATTTRRWTTIAQNRGTDITYSDSATNGGIFTVNTDGIYSMSCYEGTNANVASSGAAIYKNDSVALAYGMQIYNTANSNTKGFNASWTGFLVAGENLRYKADIAANNNGTSAFCSVAKQGSTKKFATSSSQKAVIGTSEFRFEGASAMGATATAIVNWTTLASVRGDAFTITDTTNDGTYITMNKSGRLSLSASLNRSANTIYVVLSKNQAVLTSTPTASETLAASGIGGTTTNTQSVAWEGTVAAGDVIRVSTTATPSSDTWNVFTGSFQEQEIQVSVSNTLPQFSSSDNIMVAQGNSGTSVTANVTDIPFTATGTDTKSSWNGSVYTVRDTGVYYVSTCYRLSSATSGLGMDMWKNGSVFRKLNTDAGSSSISCGTYVGQFTAGDYFSVRPTQSGTLLSSNDDHYMVVSLVGKPNVTGVDVTPFVSLEQPTDDDYVSYTPTFTGLGTPTNVTAGWARDGSDMLIRLYFTAGTTTATEARISLPTGFTSRGSSLLGSMTPVGQMAKSANGPETFYAMIEPSSTYMVFTTDGTSFNSLSKLNGNVMAASGQNFAITARIPINGWSSTSTNLISSTQTFSTDSAQLAFASSASYTLSTLSTAPVGTFITWSTSSSSNTQTQCTTAPTQTTSDMTVNGIRLYARAYNAASTCALPAKIAINVGKGMKGVQWLGYKSAAKATAVDLDYDVVSSTIAVGPNIKGYEETTGIAMIDFGFNQLSSNSTRVFGGAYDATFPTDGYVVLNTSKTPALAGFAGVAEQVRTPGYADQLEYKTYNGGTSATFSSPTACAASPCVEVEDIMSRWSACTRSGTGVYQCIAAAGTWANSVPVDCTCKSYSASGGTVSKCEVYNNGNQTWQTSSTGGMTIGVNTTNMAGTAGDAFFMVSCKAKKPIGFN